MSLQQRTLLRLWRSTMLARQAWHSLKLIAWTRITHRGKFSSRWNSCSNEWVNHCSSPVGGKWIGPICRRLFILAALPLP